MPGEPETIAFDAPYKLRLDLSIPFDGTPTHLASVEGGIDYAAAQRARLKFDRAILPLLTVLCE